MDHNIFNSKGHGIDWENWSRNQLDLEHPVSRARCHLPYDGIEANPFYPEQCLRRQCFLPDDFEILGYTKWKENDNDQEYLDDDFQKSVRFISKQCFCSEGAFCVGAPQILSVCASVVVRPSVLLLCHAQISQILPKKSKIWKNLEKSGNFGDTLKICYGSDYVHNPGLLSIIHKKIIRGHPWPAGVI